MITVVLAAVVLVISEGESWGWTDPVILGSAAVALALTPVFVLRSRRHPEPMVDLTLFESRSFGLANAASVAFGAAFAWTGAASLPPFFCSAIADPLG